MQRFVLACLLTVLVGVPAVAQPVRIAPTGPKPGEQPQVPLQDKLRYLCKQLALDEKQWQHAEGLFAILQAESQMSKEELVERLQLIQATAHELKAAEEAGDKARVAELKEKLQSMAPGMVAKRNFIAGLMPVLTEEQKAKLPALLGQIDSLTDLSLKPIQVIRAARALKLTPEQQQKLDEIAEAFRSAAPQASDSDPNRRREAVEKLVSDVAAILDAQQRARFEQEVDRFRPWAPTTAPATATAPAASTQPSSRTP